jgi:hypothetical protein
VFRDDPSTAKQEDNTTTEKFPHPLNQILPQCYLAAARLICCNAMQALSAELFF